MPTSGSGASHRPGAAAGAAAVALFAVGGLLAGTPPDFGGPPREAVAYLSENRTRIQLGSACLAASAPLLVWFLATVASLAREHGAAPARTGLTTLACGVAAVTLFMADVSALAVGALRPANMERAPELAAALLDYSFVAIAVAAFLTAGVFAGFAVLALRDRVLWPRGVGWVALAAAVACTLRVGTLFTAEGPFTAGGLVGFWLPVAGFAGGVAVASLALARRA